MLCVMRLGSLLDDTGHNMNKCVVDDTRPKLQNGMRDSTMYDNGGHVRDLRNANWCHANGATRMATRDSDAMFHPTFLLGTFVVSFTIRLCAHRPL